VTISTVEAAKRLGVSRRQVQRLIAARELPAQRTAGDAWLVDALAVNALNRARPSRGRPWTEETAWAALWWLSGIEAGWLGARTEARLRGGLRRLDAAALVAACRRRAVTYRFRASDSFTEALRAAVVRSGTSAAAAADFGLATDASCVDGYCDSPALDELVRRFRLTPDTRGNVTLRVVGGAPAGVLDRAAMPMAVVALDLAESPEVRERSAGLRVLEGLLQ